MSNLIKNRPLVSRFLDDDTSIFPRSFFDDDRFLAPTRLFNTPFFRKAEEEMTLPAVNIKERDKQFEIELAAPGYKKEDLQVEVHDGLLTISSEKKQESEVEKQNYARKEFSYSTFRRSFALPEHVDADSLKAKFADGVLKLTINKVKELPKKNGKTIKID